MADLDLTNPFGIETEDIRAKRVETVSSCVVGGTRCFLRIERRTRRELEEKSPGSPCRSSPKLWAFSLGVTGVRWA